MESAQFFRQPLWPGGPTVAEVVAELKAECEGRAFSDVIDAEGNQYVDLVMQGGGMLGIALVGYTYVLEQVGLRFLGLGGSSAGAINALLIAAVGPPAEAKSPTLLEHLAELDPSIFVDGPGPCRRLSFALANGEGLLGNLVRIALALPHLHRALGLNPGVRFLEWLRGVLGEGNATTADLLRQMKHVPPGFGPRAGREADFADPDRGPKLLGRLALVAVDAATKTKFVFPEMAGLVNLDPDHVTSDPFDPAQIHPALFVRASMSIPGFFKPLRVTPLQPDLPTTDPACPTIRDLWKVHAGYDLEVERGRFPNLHTFIDGGVVSNFPIDVFHAPRVVPLVPTFGVRLGMGGRRTEIDSVRTLGKAVFDSARHALDYDFLFHNPDYRHLIGTVNTEGYNWIDFRLTDHEKLGLFARGVEAAAQFLRGFDWDAYKDLRRNLSEANRIAEGMKAKAKQAATRPLAPVAIPAS